MHEPPPPSLVGLLEGLGLATPAQVARTGRRVRRLARELPRFESVWIDALAQARLLTAFQAAEIRAGRGARLRVGPFVLCARLPWPVYVASYQARRPETHEFARLAVIEAPAARRGEIVRQLETLAAASDKLRCDGLAPITDVGDDGQRAWAAAPWVEGRSAAEWIAHNGRLPPDVVLEIARAMLAALGRLERAGLCHGDISSGGLILTGEGRPVLLQPGLRAILRPEEGHAHADLAPEAYDYLAPERIIDAAPPSVASDLYACGCLWWHLLCGRSPLAGGDSLAKLRAAQAAEVLDVRRLAPDTPAALAAAISSCLERQPVRRPESIARLAATLGAPTDRGRTSIARHLARYGRSATWPRPPSWTFWRASVRLPRRLALTVAGLAILAAVLWAVWRPRSNGRTDEGVAVKRPAAVTLAKKHDDPPSPPPRPPRKGAEDLILSAREPLRTESLRLQAGQRVRGKRGERPVLLVPSAGLPVAAEDVCFESIDFVWNHRQDSIEGQAAVVALRAGRAEFRGCSFQTASVSPQPVAIRWTHPAEASQSDLALPSGRVQLSDCVLRGVDAAVDCRTIGARALEVTNTLHLGRGPLVRLGHCPRPEEPVSIRLSRVTLRDCGPLLECCYEQIPEQAGEIAIEASESVLAPDRAMPILLLRGREAPQRILGNVRWTGQGSLVAPATAVAAWQPPDGQPQPLDDRSVSIAGVVRSPVGFAGAADATPAASRAVRWQAPLSSADPPGIDPATLPSTDAAGGR